MFLLCARLSVFLLLLLCFILSLSFWQREGGTFHEAQGWTAFIVFLRGFISHWVRTWYGWEFTTNSLMVWLAFHGEKKPQ